MRRVVHYAAAPIPGGLLSHLLLLAPRAARNGWASEAWIRPAPALDGVAAALEERGVIVRRLCVEGKGDVRGLMSLARGLRDSRPDILHVHLASPVESLPVIFLAGRLSRARIVTTEHAPRHHPLERAWSRAAKRKAMERVSATIALSKGDAEYLAGRFGLPADRIRVVPNGVEIPRAAPAREEARRRLGIPDGVVAVGYVGEIGERKGLGDLIEATTRIDPGSGRPLLLLAGEGPFAPALRARAERAGLGDRVRLLGAIRPPDVLYAACDLFVLPSHDEAMPLALLEAMAAGRPVVATNVGGIPEVVRDGVEGRIVPPRDPPALAAALGEMIADGAARDRGGRAARERIEEAFTADMMAAATLALYDEAMAGGRP